MTDGRDAALTALKNQFDSSFRMLEVFVDVCPDDVWRACLYHFPYPVWYQVYHVAYFVDYWLREAWDGGDFRSMRFDERLPPEFETSVPADIFITRAQMSAYLSAIGKKLVRFFGALAADQIGSPILPGHDKFTYLDVVTTQIRHIMYNVGYLNGILRARGLPESDWYAYNEEN